MQLIVITPDTAIQNEPAIVNALFGNGLHRLHLRKPAFTIEDCREYISKIEQQYHEQIVIHNNFSLFCELELGGIHLNSLTRESNNLPADTTGVPRSLMSTSFHSWQEIADDTFGYGYVFISPVFDSISKYGYKAGIDLSKAVEIKQHLKDGPKIIGLGGVGGAQLEELYNNGFDGAAMLGAIWQSADPVNAFIEAAAKINALTQR